MNKYYIIESIKKNKNGHISHLMKEDNDGKLIEISPKTGREIQNWHCYWSLEEYLENGWKLVDLKHATFVGGFIFRFLDYLEEKGLIK